MYQLGIRNLRPQKKQKSEGNITEEDTKVVQGRDSLWLGANRINIYDHKEIEQEKNREGVVTHRSSSRGKGLAQDICYHINGVGYTVHHMLPDRDSPRNNVLFHGRGETNHGS